MTTFDDDMCKFEGPEGAQWVRLVELGLEWPPPEQIRIDGPAGGRIWERVSYSAITDEERRGMTHVFRGAEYQMSGIIASRTSTEEK